MSPHVCGCGWSGVPNVAPLDPCPRCEGERNEIPGRNDPCWCGSGRKYKRCAAGHLSRRMRGERVCDAEPLEPLEDLVARLVAR